MMMVTRAVAVRNTASHNSTTADPTHTECGTFSSFFFFVDASYHTLLSAESPQRCVTRVCSRRDTHTTKYENVKPTTWLTEPNCTLGHIDTIDSMDIIILRFVSGFLYILCACVCASCSVASSFSRHTQRRDNHLTYTYYII